MPFTQADTLTYRRDVASNGSHLTATDRERLLKPYLPDPNLNIPSSQPSRNVTKHRTHRKRLRPFIKSKVHFLIYFLIQTVFGIYMRLRQFYHAFIDRIVEIVHYHHRTPEYIRKDVKSLSRIPEHLAVVVTYKLEDDDGLEALMDEVAELCAWSTAAKIPLLSVYEKTGVLKLHMSGLQKLIKQKLQSYFGHPPAAPSLSVFAPNHPSMNPSPLPSPDMRAQSNGSSSGLRETTRQHLNLILLSASDGRDTLVDLTRTLTEMSQAKKIRPIDITSDLINTEIRATIALSNSDVDSNGHTAKLYDQDVDTSEPDLLIIFGPYVKLDGYPPWQIRLTEIFCTGDSGGNLAKRVEYQGFIRGLWKYAGAEMRFGR